MARLLLYTVSSADLGVETSQAKSAWRDLPKGELKVLPGQSKTFSSTALDHQVRKLQLMSKYCKTPWREANVYFMQKLAQIM